MKVFYGEFHAKRKRGAPKIVIRAASPTRPHLEQTLRRGIEWHCEHCKIEPKDMLEQFLRGAWDMRIMDAGVAYCGSWPIPQPGTGRDARCQHMTEGMK